MMVRASLRSRSAAGVVLAVCLLLPTLASAQSIGVGARLSWVRGSAASPDTASARYWGAYVRARTSPHTALELSLDYRKVTNDSLASRTRDLPIQASLLVYGPRTPLTFYLLGGAGWYNQRIEFLDGQATTSTTKMGYHAGVGGELELGRHATLHVDYRYTLIHIGGSEGEAGAVPIPGTTSLQEKLKLSHEGSMWTAGVTVYF